MWHSCLYSVCSFGPLGRSTTRFAVPPYWRAPACAIGEPSSCRRLFQQLSALRFFNGGASLLRIGHRQCFCWLFREWSAKLQCFPTYQSSCPSYMPRLEADTERFCLLHMLSCLAWPRWSHIGGA